MLSAEDNQLLTETGAGTPMGEYLRQFWWPAARSESIVAGAEPTPARILGTDIVLYRTDAGQLGCVDEKCPHRQASLRLAKPNGAGITCIYHGWEFGPDGKCVNVPTEPAARREAFAARLKVNRHPVAESSGLVYVFLGDPDLAPPLPRFSFDGLPAGQSQVVGGMTNCNWFQCLEGLADTVHTGQLHQMRFPGLSQVRYESAAGLEIDRVEYGLRLCADRPAPEMRKYLRITEFAAPAWFFVPNRADEDHVSFCIVPVDDEHTMQWLVWHDLNSALGDKTVLGEVMSELLDHPDDVTLPLRGKPKWGQDRGKLGRDHFTGIANLVWEDIAVQESQGVVMDRTKEHLGSSDQGVGALRRQLAAAARTFRDTGEVFADPRSVDLAKVRGLAIEVAASTDWRTVTA